MPENALIEIKNLSHITWEEIHKAWSDAFSDYAVPFELTVADLVYMLERRGCDLSMSFGAFDDGQLVGFIFNGIGQWNGKRTAYDTGTGLVKKYRRRGIATRLFDESLPLLRQNGIEQYLLEVIQTNTSAVDLYRKKGFKVVREFDCYISTKDKCIVRDIKLDSNISFQIIKEPDWELFKSSWDFQPSWQNSIDSINRKIDHFTTLVIMEDAEPVGYGIIENHTSDIPQLAIKQSHRRKGLATALVKELLKYSHGEKIKIINVVSNSTTFKEFANSINLKIKVEQYEMILDL